MMEMCPQMQVIDSVSGRLIHKIPSDGVLKMGINMKKRMKNVKEKVYADGKVDMRA